MKKLNEQEINQLFDFTKKHFVDHYDVQVELVDHLANAIEMEWETNPATSFSDALDKEFKKFGVFGFSGLVEQKQTALQNRYWKEIKNEMIRFFSIPKIILSGGLFYVLFQSFASPSSFILEYDYLIQLALIAVTIVMYFILKNQNKSDKKWLIQSTANYLFSLPFIFLIYFRIGFYNSVSNPSFLKILFNTISTELYILFLLILYFKISSLIKNEIQKMNQKFQQI